MRTSARNDRGLSQTIGARLATLPVLAGDCVHLWHLECGSDRRNGDDVLASLDSSERARASRFSLASSRREFAIGRSTLRVLLAAYTDRSPRDVVLEYGKSGKPHILPADNTQHIEFSIAHSSGRILFAVTRGRAVGIDVERERQVAGLPSVARAVLTRHEWSTWSAMGDDDRVSLFFLAWVRKEAVLKACGCGLSVRPSRIAVSVARDAPPAAVSLADDARHRSWWLSDIRQQRGWSAALALEGARDAAVCYAGFH